MKANTINSASAINAINQCKRKYYYQYKEKIPGKKNIYLMGGDIVHKAIKEKINNSNTDIEKVFDELWNKTDFSELGISRDELEGHYHEYKQMVFNWEKDFNPNLNIKSEVRLFSDKYKVIGYVDEIIEENGKIIIVENKGTDKLKEEHILQSAIYSLLYLENYRKMPDLVLIRLLKSGEKQLIEVDEKLLAKARYECSMMRLKVISNDINDYPKNTSGLCKWRTGECSFYETCRPFKI